MKNLKMGIQFSELYYNLILYIFASIIFKNLNGLRRRQAFISFILSIT